MTTDISTDVGEAEPRERHFELHLREPLIDSAFFGGKRPVLGAYSREEPSHWHRQVTTNISLSLCGHVAEPGESIEICDGDRAVPDCPRCIERLDVGEALGRLSVIGFTSKDANQDSALILRSDALGAIGLRDGEVAVPDSMNRDWTLARREDIRGG